MHNSLKASGLVLATAVATVLSACGGDSAPPPPVTPAPTSAIFEVTLTNLTAGQPLSPFVAIAHGDGFAAFTVGQPASVELEKLAESGQSAPLVALAGDSKSVFAAAAAATGLPPGPDSKATVMLTVPIASLPSLRLSMASMLGNTNDGFAGLNRLAISSLPVGTTMNSDLIGYDAGTELNTESADTVPGPATANSGGKREGFNSTRDDISNTVHVHAGIVSRDDGLPGSALTDAQRWDNPVARLSIKRVQ